MHCEYVLPFEKNDGTPSELLLSSPLFMHIFSVLATNQGRVQLKLGSCDAEGVYYVANQETKKPNETKFKIRHALKVGQLLIKKGVGVAKTSTEMVRQC